MLQLGFVGAIVVVYINVVIVTTARGVVRTVQSSVGAVQFVEDGRQAFAFALFPRHIVVDRVRMIVVVGVGVGTADQMAAGRIRVANQVAGLRHRHEFGRGGRVMVEELGRYRGGKVTCRGRNFDAVLVSRWDGIYEW